MGEVFGAIKKRFDKDAKVGKIKQTCPPKRPAKMSEADCSWLKSFIERQQIVTEKYKDIASDTNKNSYREFVDFRANSEKLADAGGYRSESAKKMPSEVQQIIDEHESDHQGRLYLTIPKSFWYMTTDKEKWAKFMAAEEVKAHSISNKRLNDLYKKECEKAREE